MKDKIKTFLILYLIKNHLLVDYNNDFYHLTKQFCIRIKEYTPNFFIISNNKNFRIILKNFEITYREI